MSRKKQEYRSIDAVWDDGTTANQTEHISREFLARLGRNGIGVRGCRRHSEYMMT